MEAALVENSNVIMQLTNENNELKHHIKRLNMNLDAENYELKTRVQEQGEEIGRVEFMICSMEEQVDGVKELNKILCTLMDESKSHAKQMEKKLVAVQSENNNLIIK